MWLEYTSDFWSDSYCPCPVQCPALVQEFQAIKTAACQNFVVWLFSCCFLLRFVNWSFLRELFFQVDQILTKLYFVGSTQDGTRDTESVGDCWSSQRTFAKILQSRRRPFLDDSTFSFRHYLNTKLNGCLNTIRRCEIGTLMRFGQHSTCCLNGRGLLRDWEIFAMVHWEL